MALKMRRLYMKRIQYEMGSQWSFSGWGVACLILSMLMPQSKKMVMSTWNRNTQ